MRIKKRPTPKPKSDTEGATVQCHYQVLRLPERNVDASLISSSRGAGADARMVVVAQSAIAITSYTKPDDLFERIVQEDHWYITNKPARYIVASSEFHLSFTFIVLPDKSYHRGFNEYPKLIEQLLHRPS